MKNETFEILKEYELQFKQIKESNFCRLPGTPTLKILDECYREIFGKVSKLLNGCSSCIFSSLRDLSREYWKEVDRRTELENVTSEESTKKKRGRPKKATNNDTINE